MGDVYSGPKSNHEEEDEITICMVNDSKPPCDQRLVRYTDSERDKDKNEQPIPDEKNEVTVVLLSEQNTFLTAAFFSLSKTQY